ncbi:MAG: hypothetical protein ACHQD8_01760 [Chitinophagales bacterium]
MKCLLYFFAFCIVAGITFHAQATTKKKNKTYLKLIEAYTQRTLPGRKESPPMTGTHFIIIWEYAKYPETFFWRGEGGWLSCNMLKAHKVTNRSHDMPRGMDYRTEFVTGDQVHKGDTLELSPVTGGKFPIPAEIPKDAKNTLFFKTGGSGWLSFPVDKITKKQDIVMP